MTTVLSPGSCGVGEGSCLSPWRPHFRGQCGSRCSCQAWLGFGPRPALGMRQDVAPPGREEQVPGFWAGGCGHSYNPQLTPYRLLEPVPRGFRRVGSMNGALWPATVLRKALGCCVCDGQQGILPPCIRPQQDMRKTFKSAVWSTCGLSSRFPGGTAARAPRSTTALRSLRVAMSPHATLTLSFSPRSR